MRVLVAEDFRVLAEAIGTGLRREGMAVDVVLDGDDALEHLAVTRYDVVVLDRDLPGTHGDEVCRRIVADGPDSRVLMLTAASTVRDRVDGLGLGADDYLTKPFDFAELVARVRALGRRSAVALPPVLESGDLVLDPSRRAAFRAGRRLDLSPKEFAVLEASFESQRRFVANASHELRTPLAAERTLLQVALADPGATAETLRSACEQLLSLGAQQERLIDALLTLASSQQGIERWEPVDIAAITGNVLAARGEEAMRRGIRIDAAVGPAAAPGDPRLVESMVANLADNALRHNVTGGSVEVGTSMTAGLASLWVANTGPVIPAAEVDRLFQPFQQLGADRVSRDGDGGDGGGGHGLGLAIVRAIAIAHGAVLTARARPGGGMEIKVDFDRVMAG